jgi:LemA protein
MTPIYISLAAGAATFVWGVLTFNALVSARSRADEAWSGIEVQLNRRHDLVPSLVETVKGYAEHEAGVLQAAADARENAENAGGRRCRQGAEQELTSAIAAVRAVGERYPQLTASENFVRLEAQLAEVEGEIQYARRLYNSNVERYNARVRMFPSSLIARVAQFQPRGYFDLDRLPRGFGSSGEAEAAAA